MDTSWYSAKLAALGLAPEKIDEQEQAERLARRMRARLDDLLSRDVNITARALRLYDPELPKKLTAAWQVETTEDGGDSPRSDPEALEDERERANGGEPLGGGGWSERHRQKRP
jgi:hypothetical protein